MRKLKFYQKLTFKTFIRLFLIMGVVVTLIHGMFYYISVRYNLKKESSKTEEVLVSSEKIIKSLDKGSALTALEQIAESSDTNISVKYDGEDYFFKSKSYLLNNFFEENMINLPNDPKYDSMLLKTKDITVNGKDIKIQTARSTGQIKESRNISLSYLPYSLIGAILISGVASYFYARKITKPVLKIEETLEDMKNLKENARIKIDSNDEIGELSDRINTMYVNLLQSIREYEIKNNLIVAMENERSEFLKQSSHELKTPMAKLSVLLENMILNTGRYKDRDKYLKEAYEITEEASDMIRTLITKNRNRGYLNKCNDSMGLSELLQDSIDQYSLLLNDKNLKVYQKIYTNNNRSNIFADHGSTTDQRDLRILFSNLISNIAKHSKRDSEVSIEFYDNRIKLRSVPEKDLNIVTEMINSKLGNDKDDKERYSQKEGINSSDLGLGIIKNICEKYGIGLSYSSSEKELITELIFRKEI